MLQARQVNKMTVSELYRSIEDAIRENLDCDKPDNLDEALELCNTTLHQELDNALIYTHRVLELWDGDTHDDICLADYDTISDAISASTYMQLYENCSDVVNEALENWVNNQIQTHDNYDVWQTETETNYWSLDNAFNILDTLNTGEW